MVRGQAGGFLVETRDHGAWVGDRIPLAAFSTDNAKVETVSRDGTVTPRRQRDGHAVRDHRAAQAAHAVISVENYDRDDSPWRFSQATFFPS